LVFVVPAVTAVVAYALALIARRKRQKRQASALTRESAAETDMQLL
jgi:hypothetical protein